MSRLRPRISLLAALLLMTIVGMAIVILQLWREVGPLRAEVQQLRDQVGVLTIDDPSEIPAIDIPTDQEGVWKWRVYVPKGQRASLIDKWGDIARTGYPEGGHQTPVGDGEQILTLTVKRLEPPSKDWIGQFRTPEMVTTVSVSPQDYFMSGPSTSRNQGLEHKTTKIADDRLLLMHSRVAPSGQTSLLDKDDPLPGFMVWLERR